MTDDEFPNLTPEEIAELEAAEGKPPLTLLGHYGAYDGRWLAQQTFPPTKFVVPGLISEGLSLLIAAPKIGKSWFVLALADATARGGDFMGIDVEQRPVLYMATEDVPKRIQERGEILGIPEFPSDCMFIHRFDPADTLAIMREFMSMRSDQRPLVIIDTLGMVKPSKGSSQDSYDHDYKTLAAIKGVADEFGGASLVVHHNRKAEAEDFIDSINGTQGIAGAADTIIVLRRKRGESDAQLHMTSRDSGDEGSYAANFDGGHWSMPGGALSEAARALGQREARKALDDDSLAILELVNDREAQGYATTPGDVADRMGWEKKKAGTYLARLSEHHIRRSARGVYRGLPQGSVESGVSVESRKQEDSTVTTQSTLTSVKPPVESVGGEAPASDPEPAASPVWGQKPEVPELDLGIPEAAPLSPKDIGHREEILAHLIEHGPADRGTLAQATHKAPEATSSTLTRAVRKKYVHKQEDGLYGVTEAGREYLADKLRGIAS